MSRSRGTIDGNRVMQDFHRFHNNAANLETGICVRANTSTQLDSTYLPFKRLKAYFALHEVEKLWNVNVSSFGDDTVLETIQLKYPRVFAILLALGRGYFIQHFINNTSLDDQHLPFETRPAHFPWEGKLEPDFFPEFQKMQYKFWQPPMEYRSYCTWPADYILPIKRGERLGGSSSVTYEIQICEGYNELHRSSVSIDTDLGDRFTNTFVLKTYTTHEAETDFDAERKAFLHLRRNCAIPNLINFYGSYQHGNTFNIILEYANKGNLEEYFQNVPPPATKIDILDFWEGILKLIKALTMIHGNRLSDSTSQDQQHLFWHQDVKPENILVSVRNNQSIYKANFKIADLGLSHFKKKDGESQLDFANFGTRTYGAPECYRFDDFIDNCDLPVTPTIDVWSLGCVFSEAATWAVYNKNGLDAYRQTRKCAVRHTAGQRDPDCFHDGKYVLPQVLRHHEQLKADLEDRAESKRDVITPKIIGMSTDMLMHCSSRENALGFYKSSMQILKEARERIEPSQSSLASNLPPRTRTRPSTPASHVDGSPKRPSSPNSSVQLFPYSSPLGPTSAFVSPSQVETNAEASLTQAINTSAKNEPFCHAGASKSNTADVDFSGVGSQQDLSLHDPSSVDTPFGIINLESVQKLTTVPNSRRFQTNPNMAVSPDEIPRLDVEKASEYREAKRRGEHRALKGAAWLNEIDQRDHVFLLDDSKSMLEHWDNVKKLFDILAYLVKFKDPDELELYFMINSHTYKGKNATALVRSVEKCRPTTDSPQSNIAISLGSILQRYSNLLIEADSRRHSGQRRSTVGRIFGKNPNETRPLSLYIFTDGIWQPKADPIAPIFSLIRTLEKLNTRSDQVGIQFIQFGKNAEASLKLQFLDRMGMDSRFNMARDIIDHEPADENVFKMLLGATNKWFDNDFRHNISAAGQLGGA